MILCPFNRVGPPLVPIFVQVIVPDSDVKFGFHLGTVDFNILSKLIGYFIKIAATTALVGI